MNLKSKLSDKAARAPEKANKAYLLKRLGKIIKPDRAPDAGKPEKIKGAPSLPDILDGSAFLDKITGLMPHDDRFGFLMVKADGHDAVAEETDPDTQPGKAADIAAVVGSICKDSAGTWGQVDNGLFGCYLPGSDDHKALTVSEEIQMCVKRRHDGSVSIGVAAYPMLDYEKEKVLDNAKKALAHAAFFGPDSIVAFDAVSLNISGDVMYQEGDISGAMEEFKMGLRINPDEENLHNSLGVCYGEQGDLEAALAAFEKASGIDPDNVMALHNAGYVKSMMGDPEGALACFLKADQLDGNLFEVALHTGKLYVDTGKPAEAKPFLEKAVGLNPDSGPAHFYMGECFRQIKQPDRAIASYKQAVKRNPMDAASLSVLGFLYDERGENPEIPLIFCENSVRISPDNGLYAYRLGCVYEKSGALDKALGMFETALELGHDANEKISALKTASEQKNRDGVSPVAGAVTES